MCLKHQLTEIACNVCGEALWHFLTSKTRLVCFGAKKYLPEVQYEKGHSLFLSPKCSITTMFQKKTLQVMSKPFSKMCKLWYWVKMTSSKDRNPKSYRLEFPIQSSPSIHAQINPIKKAGVGFRMRLTSIPSHLYQRLRS